MPTITAEFNDLQQLLNKNLSIDELIPLLDYAKAELKNYDSETGEIRIELKDTNRPDLWCAEGIARQIRFAYDQPVYAKLLKPSDIHPDHRISVHENVRQIRPYICAFIAKGIPVTEQMLVQLINTQEKLSESFGKKREFAAIGIYNAGKIKFPIEYKAVAPDEIRFIPLDSDEEMNLNQILLHHPKGMEYSVLLKNKTMYPILLDAAGDVLSFPPVINSRKSGKVVPGDDNLFIEVTGTDIDMCLHVANILAYNFADRGFDIKPVAAEYPYVTSYGKRIYSPYPLSNEVWLEKSMIENYTGCSYTPDEVINKFRQYGVTAELITADGKKIKAYTYPYRQDYLHPVDAVEDFIISCGYNTFDPVMPSSFTVGSMKPFTLFEDNVRETMTWMGFEEVILNILTNKADFTEYTEAGGSALLEISNPLSENYTCLRNSLLPSLLNVEANSFKSIYPHRIFEVGEVVIRDGNENHRWATRSMLGILTAHAEANFSEMGSCLSQLQHLILGEMKIRSNDHPLFITGRSGQIIADNQQVGMIGEVHPEVLDKWGIRMPCVIMEIDLSKIFEKMEK